MLITGLILAGLIVDLGGGPDHERIGFRVSGVSTLYALDPDCTQYWRNPGAIAPAGLEPKHIGLDRFLGVLSVLINAAFSFQGMELVAMSVSTVVSLRRFIS